MDWVDLEIVPQHATTETVLAAAHAEGTQRRKDNSDDRSRMRNLKLRLLVLVLAGVALTLLVPG